MMERQHLALRSGEASPLSGSEFAPGSIQIQVLGQSPSEPRMDQADGASSYWRVVMRRKFTILGIALVCALVAFLAGLPQEPEYQARTSLEIQGINENFLNIREVDPTGGATNDSPEAYIQTQVKLLQEDALVERVATKLRLDRRPEFAARSGRLGWLRRLLRIAPPRPIPPLEQAVEWASDRLRVRVAGQTRVVEVLFDSPDPQLAADFANTLANEFIEQTLEVRWQAAQKTSQWLTRQLDDLKSKLERSQAQLLAYADAAGLLITSDKGNVAEEKLRQLQEELSRSQAERVARQSRYETAASSPPDSLPEVLDSEAMRSLRAQLNDLRRQLSELSVQFTPAFYKVKNVQAQIAEIESILKKQRADIVDRIRNEYESALRREKLVAGAFADQALVVSRLAAKAVEYDLLKHEADTNRALYESMLQKVKEAGVASAIRASNIRVIHPARPPSRPHKPNLPLNAGLGFGGGLLLGILFALNRERAGGRIRLPGDAALYVEVPELGVIPSAGSRGIVDSAGPRSHVELAMWERKPSPLAESFRATLASILFAGKDGKRPGVIVITSPRPGAGKTTMVTNLGIALAEINRRVLLVDGDLRKPRLGLIFGLPKRPGLGQILREGRPIEDYAPDELACTTTVPGLYVLPAGAESEDISSLLYSERMAELLWRARLEYHTVLIDSPPMLALPDARILGKVSDGVILVFRAARTTREEALAASQRLRDDGTLVLGAILNDWEPGDGPGAYYSSPYWTAGRRAPAPNRSGGGFR